MFLAGREGSDQLVTLRPNVTGKRSSMDAKDLMKSRALSSLCLHAEMGNWQIRSMETPVGESGSCILWRVGHSVSKVISQYKTLL